ncbi:unnamed protein product, partial [Urochloa humidicola]
MENEESPIKKFYPSQLKIDTHGKRFLWQVHEMYRNTVQNDKIFMRNSNNLASNAALLQISDCSSKKLPVDPSISELGGWLSSVNDDDISCGFFRSPIKDREDIMNDQTVSFIFFNPEPVKTIPRLLEHVEKPEKTLTEADISRKPLWHTYPGSRP